eukprot:10412764-Prorocentrum_lima.AAC.1
MPKPSVGRTACCTFTRSRPELRPEHGFAVQLGIAPEAMPGDMPATQSGIMVKKEEVEDLERDSSPTSRTKKRIRGKGETNSFVPMVSFFSSCLALVATMGRPGVARSANNIQDKEGV